MLNRKWPMILICSLMLAACSPTPPETEKEEAAASPTANMAHATVAQTATGTPIPVSPTMRITPTPNPRTPTPEPAAFTYDEALPYFAYDPTLPLDVSVVSEDEQDGVIIQDITYAAYDAQLTRSTQGRISAYVVAPDGDGPFAGVLFLHQLERDQDREEFLEEATLLARQGVVSVLPDGLFPWRVRFSGNGARDQKNIVNQVIELRRALDLLLAQSKVDPQRIGYVGHDYGAIHGALLAGIENRVKAYVFMAGDDNYANWALRYFVHPGNVDLYRKTLAGTDPINYVSHAAPAALLFQFATRDRFVSQETALRFFEAASEPKEILWYGADHNLNEEARQDRADWLANALGLSPDP